jgi:hypothetical protein
MQDPFTKSTKIPCFIPECNLGEIVVRNLLGVIVLKENLQPGWQVLEINCSNFVSGIYLYSLEVDGKQLATKKMVIAK